MSDTLRFGFVGGGGWLGGAIVRSALKDGTLSPEQISISYRTVRPVPPEGVYVTMNNQELVERSDVIVLCTRPKDWRDLSLDLGGKLAISVMAGVTLAQLSNRHNTSRVVRSLPNAAAEVGHSYTPWFGTPQLSVQDRGIVMCLFDACGKQDEVATERDIDYLTALSGSGPAFPAMLAAAMMSDAIMQGLPAHIARRAVNSLLVGSGRLIEKHNGSPADTVETFRAYRGTTAAAIDAMDASGFQESISAALDAGYQKSLGLTTRSDLKG